MSKLTFAVGAAGVGIDVVHIADNNGMFATPVMTFFTIVVGLIICILGGLAAMLLMEWANNFKEWTNRKLQNE